MFPGCRPFYHGWLVDASQNLHRCIPRCLLVGREDDVKDAPKIRHRLFVDASVDVHQTGFLDVGMDASRMHLWMIHGCF